MSKGGVKSRREALAMASAFLVTAACSRERIFGVECRPSEAGPLQSPIAVPTKDVYVVDSFTGLQLGTRDNPYAVRSTLEFDALMRLLSSDDALAIHLTGKFGTRGSYEWGDYAYLGWRAGKYWTFDGDGEIAIDPNAIRDTEIDDAPLRIITTREQLAFGDPDALTPEQIWAGLPVGQAVRGLSFVGNHSLLADRWKAKGKMLRTSAVILQGHNATIEGAFARDFGALRGGDTTVGAESFTFVICGAMGSPDRNKIAQLDPTTHRFDETGEPSHITATTFDRYNQAASDDQVTVRMIVGSLGQTAGGWVHTFRSDCYQESNITEASGANLVQAHTIYQALNGRVRWNRSRSARVGYYGDFYRTKGLSIEHNDFEDCDHGVALYLSPSPADLARDFSHEDYRIGENRISSKGANVSLNTFGPSTDARFIRGISVDSSLSVESVGDAQWTRDACRMAA